MIHLRGIIHLTAAIKMRISLYRNRIRSNWLGAVWRSSYNSTTTGYNWKCYHTVSKLRTHFYGQRVAIINHLSRGALTDPKKKKPYNVKVSQANKPKRCGGRRNGRLGRFILSIDKRLRRRWNGLFVCFGEFRPQNVGGKSIINDVNCQFLPHKQRGQNGRIKIERTLRPCTTY